MSTTYHPQTSGKTNKVSYVIEHTIKMYVMGQPFFYNNGYHAYLNMSPFEALNRRKCNTTIFLEYT